MRNYARIYRQRIKTGRSARDVASSYGKASTMKAKAGAVSACIYAMTAWMKRNMGHQTWWMFPPRAPNRQSQSRSLRILAHRLSGGIG